MSYYTKTQKLKFDPDVLSSDVLSRDPIGENGGVNLYAMVNNNPVNKWDWLGFLEHRTMNFVIGNQRGFTSDEEKRLEEYRKTMQQIVDECLKMLKDEKCFDCKVKFNIKSAPAMNSEELEKLKDYPAGKQYELDNAARLLKTPGQPLGSIYVLFIDHIPDSKKGNPVLGYSNELETNNIIIANGFLFGKITEAEKLIIPHELGHTGGYIPYGNQFDPLDDVDKKHHKDKNHLMHPTTGNRGLDRMYCGRILDFCKKDEREK